MKIINTVSKFLQTGKFDKDGRILPNPLLQEEAKALTCEKKERM